MTSPFDRTAFRLMYAELYPLQETLPLLADDFCRELLGAFVQENGQALNERRQALSLSTEDLIAFTAAESGFTSWLPPNAPWARIIFRARVVGRLFGLSVRLAREQGLGKSRGGAMTTINTTHLR